MTERMTAAEYQASAKQPKQSRSDALAARFLFSVRAHKLPLPRCKAHAEGELRFMSGETITRQNRRLKRRDASPAWRFDFAWPDQRIAVEIEGVSVRKVDGKTQMGGRHANIAGFKDDCEKYAWAAVMGWRVLRFEQSQVVSGFAIDMTVRMFASLELDAMTPAQRRQAINAARGTQVVSIAPSRMTDELNFGNTHGRDPF